MIDKQQINNSNSSNSSDTYMYTIYADRLCARTSKNLLLTTLLLIDYQYHAPLLSYTVCRVQNLKIVLLSAEVGITRSCKSSLELQTRDATSLYNARVGDTRGRSLGVNQTNLKRLPASVQKTVSDS
jgi:hypothetical protein